MRCYDFLPDELVRLISEYLPNAKKQHEKVVAELERTSFVMLTRESVVDWILTDPFRFDWYLDLPVWYYREGFELGVSRVAIHLPVWCLFCQGVRQPREPDHTLMLNRSNGSVTTLDVIYALRHAAITTCSHNRLVGFTVRDGVLLLHVK